MEIYPKQELHLWLNEQGKLYSRIVELSNILSHAIVIDEDDPQQILGHRQSMTVEAMEGGEKGLSWDRWPQEADPMNGRISKNPPLDRRSWGKKCGEEVPAVPASTIHYRVIEIQK